MESEEKKKEKKKKKKKKKNREDECFVNCRWMSNKKWGKQSMEGASRSIYFSILRY